MKLSDAASYFDRLNFFDAYSGTKLFKGQFDLFDGSKRDGITDERRTFSAKASITMPTRGAVIVNGQPFIVGGPNPDFFDDSAIRVGYVISKVDGMATVRSLSQAIDAAGGTMAYAARSFLKEAREISESANVYPIYELVFAVGETLAPTNVVGLAGRHYLVRSVYTGQSGFLKALVDEMPEPVVISGVWAAQSLDPVTEIVTPTNTTVSALLVRWQSGFEFLTAASMRYTPGDEIAIVKSTVGSPATGDLFTIGGVARRILAVVPIDDCLRLHLRHV